MSSPAREPLTPDRVAAAAVALADQEGLEAVTMRRLARELGVEAMSLYNHIPGKDALQAQMVDRVIGEMALPDLSGDWRAELARAASSMRTVLRAHRWAAPMILSTLSPGPALLARWEAVLACLDRAGFSIAGCDHAKIMIDSYVHGFVQHELLFPLEEQDYASAAAAYIDQLPPETYPTVHRMTRAVMERRYSGILSFDLGLRQILGALSPETLP